VGFGFPPAANDAQARSGLCRRTPTLRRVASRSINTKAAVKVDAQALSGRA
jgi:hypothetical protein